MISEHSTRFPYINFNVHSQLLYVFYWPIRLQKSINPCTDVNFLSFDNKCRKKNLRYQLKISQRQSNNLWKEWRFEQNWLYNTVIKAGSNVSGYTWKEWEKVVNCIISMFICFLFFISGSTVNGSNCPPGAMNIAQNCIKNSVPLLLPTERSVDAEIEVWRRVCLYVE